MSSRPGSVASWVLLLASAVGAAAQTPASQGPVFRGGTTLVQVDAIVADAGGRPLTNLSASDFELLDDGRPVALTEVRFLGATPYAGDAVLAPIRTNDDETREASRDDVRVYAIFLDDYHVARMGELRVIDPLLAFIGALPSTDLVGVYYPLDSVTDVHFARDRGPVLKAVRDFKGRRGDYQPMHPVEEEHLRHPVDIERIRRQITATALEGLATHLGGLKQGRKTVLFVSEGFTQPMDELQDVYQAANRGNVAIYPIDPRGLTTGVDRGRTARQALAMVVPDREMLRTLAEETGGRAIVERNDIRGGLEQVLRDATAYYLIAYESPHPGDGKFHRVTVRLKRTRASVFARPGYWSFKPEQIARSSSAAVFSIPVEVQEALGHLADSLRPDAGEPAERRRRVDTPRPAIADAAALLGVPTVALGRGRNTGEIASRREFHSAEMLVVRTPARSDAEVTARLLDRLGQPRIDLPLTIASGVAELRLPVGSLGPGDYVIELTARAGEDSVRRYVAFRTVR